jgi:hypothetical protein
MANEEEQNWLAVIGRALALRCLAESDHKGKDLATQARFLESLGISRKESASLLGSTEASISELLRRAKKQRKTKNGRKKA